MILLHKDEITTTIEQRPSKESDSRLVTQEIVKNVYFKITLFWYVTQSRLINTAICVCVTIDGVWIGYWTY
jgi:hypothetical protein